jgi:REP element-mobilizing transposase RayT
MSNGKHYVNPKQPGQLCFVTATCLDFAHLFAREEMRTRMCLSLFQDCIRWNASLKAFVIMTHHIHLIVKPDKSKCISHLMGEIKAKSQLRLSPHLLLSELRQLEMQSGLNRNQFWKRSFRANPLFSPDVYDQKLTYLHANPVRAGLVELPEDYIWSSMYMHQMGLMIEGESVDLQGAKKLYQSLLNGV